MCRSHALMVFGIGDGGGGPGTEHLERLDRIKEPGWTQSGQTGIRSSTFFEKWVK